MYSICATSRRRNRKDLAGVRWLPLELGSNRSVHKFLKRVQELKFDRIICLIGGTSVEASIHVNLDDLQYYYKVFISNLFFVLQELQNSLKDESNMLVMSSRAANSKSFDPHYAATKGAVESLVNSLSGRLSEGKSIVAVSSGLIVDSKMYQEMGMDIRNQHLSKSNFKLLNLEDATSKIWNLTPEITKPHNGEVLKIGVVY